ncbi:hypothetical protein MARI151_20652 [Maribacter litoralis]|uniref:Uncharacterized protein n=1 Tax=Maribacter litoralis TaxID=2059726 RepID=A0A653QTV9_9FLAO|nr:hypothetical protein MARI151_20652 [Maribacter litoralis]
MGDPFISDSLKIFWKGRSLIGSKRPRFAKMLSQSSEAQQMDVAQYKMV